MGMHATAWIACQENEHLGEIYMEIERINWVVKSKIRVILTRVLVVSFLVIRYPSARYCTNVDKDFG